MTRTSLSFLLVAIFFCGVALVTMENVETIVTICTVIVAAGCVVAGVVAMRKRPTLKCWRCGRPRLVHCASAPHVWPDNTLMVHDHAFIDRVMDKAEPRQSTSDITPQPHSLPGVGEGKQRLARRVTNIRRRAEKKGYER